MESVGPSVDSLLGALPNSRARVINISAPSRFQLGPCCSSSNACTNRALRIERGHGARVDQHFVPRAAAGKFPGQLGSSVESTETSEETRSGESLPLTKPMGGGKGKARHRSCRIEGSALRQDSIGRDGEVHRDLSLGLNRIRALEVRLKAPLSNCLARGPSQNGRSAHHMQILNGPIAANERL